MADVPEVQRVAFAQGDFLDHSVNMTWMNVRRKMAGVNTTVATLLADTTAPVTLAMRCKIIRNAVWM